MRAIESKIWAELFDAKPAEIKALFNSTLEASRAMLLRDKMLRAGLPL